MIPAEQWWSIIEAYGARIWPAQIIFYSVAILLIGWLSALGHKFGDVFSSR